MPGAARQLRNLAGDDYPRQDCRRWPQERYAALDLPKACCWQHNDRPAWTGRLRRLELGRQALIALTLFDRDTHYLVRDGKVVIIDENTGRPMPDRTWEQGLHQLIEIKEGAPLTHPNETLSRLSFQRFFRQYHHLGGMTGAASEVAGELWSAYDLSVTCIPTHRPTRLENRGAQVVETVAQKWVRVAGRVAARHAAGQPVLIGTRTVGASEALSAVLTRAGLAHQVLNARQDSGEAEIVASLEDHILCNHVPRAAAVPACLPEGSARTRLAVALMRLQQKRAGRLFAARRGELLKADEQEMDTLSFAGRYA